MLKEQILLGTDPELFAKHKTTGVKEPVASILGDFTIQGTWGNIMPDGAALEFTVAPSGYPVEMTNRIAQMVADAQALLPEEYELVSDHIMHINPPDLEKYGEEYGQANICIFGCNPDINVYGLDSTLPEATETPLRSTGGHIHVEIGELINNAELVYLLAMTLDLLIGTADVYLHPSEDAAKRRTLYGRAGSIRLNYELSTMEYRTLSAKTLLLHPDITTLLFSIVQELVYSVYQVIEVGLDPIDYLRSFVEVDDDFEMVARVIERNDALAARDWAAEFVESNFVENNENEELASLVSQLLEWSN